MKPKNKTQQLIIDLRNQLPPITQEQKKYAEFNLHGKYCATAYSKKHYCLECGNVWDDNKAETLKNKGCTCKKCNSKLTLIKDWDRHATESKYYAILTAIKDFQVVKVYQSHKHLKKGSKYRYHIEQVLQHWVDVKGNMHTISRPTKTFSYYGDDWAYGELEFRTPNIHKDHHKKYLNIEKIYPKMKILPTLKRNGFKTSTHRVLPHLLFKTLLQNPKAETLFKAKQYDLVDEISRGYLNADQYWTPLKIAIRNDYKVKNVSDWKDYVNLLSFFGKDLHNADYVCPSNLKQAHDKYVKKKAEFDKQEKFKQQKAKIKKANKEYQKEKSKFFGLMFTKGELKITPLKSVKAFLEEAETMKHCLFSNEYYNKSNSLILSAEINGNKIETIELSLTDFKIIQSRGKHNTATKHNKEIKTLINQNIKSIKNIALKQAS